MTLVVLVYMYTSLLMISLRLQHSITQLFFLSGSQKITHHLLFTGYFLVSLYLCVWLFSACASVDFVKCFGAAGGLHNELSASVVESLVNDVLGYIKALGYSDFDSILRKIFHNALPTGKIYHSIYWLCSYRPRKWKNIDQSFSC